MNRAGAGNLGLFTTLVACAAKHFLVLLLPHALPALFDQRTHKEGNTIGRGKTCHARYRGIVSILSDRRRPTTVSVRGRLMVGQRFLVPPVGVRILSPER